MSAIKIAQLITAILLTLVILLQSRGASVGGLFGGSGGVYLAKRGLEKKLFVVTIVLAVAFFLLSLSTIIF